MDSDHNELSQSARQRRLLLQAIGGATLVGGLALSGRSVAQPLIRAEETDVLDVAIIGAGLAGLTAARDLHRCGFR